MIHRVPVVAFNRRAGGWPPGMVVPAGTMVRRSVLPYSIPHAHFTQAVQVPIGPYGFAQGIVSGAGAVTLSVGPAGMGTSWDLAQLSVNTTTGANDTSTVSVFAQPAGSPAEPFQVGQSYAGGGDQIGLTGIKMVVGERLYAVWAGGHPGDTATFILTGVMTVLT